jgi:hypothetical protein
MSSTARSTRLFYFSFRCILVGYSSKRPTMMVISHWKTTHAVIMRRIVMPRLSNTPY